MADRSLTTHRIRVARERFKFSCAHMTVFPDGTAERLHGHNFTLAVACELSDISFDHLVDFGLIEDAAERLCGEWKEHLLLPRDNPHLEVVRDDGQEIEFVLCARRYAMPCQDVILLPIDNVAVESLSALAVSLLLEMLRPRLGSAVRSIEVTVEESPGQGASTRRKL